MENHTSTHSLAWKNLADELEEKVRLGTWNPGERLPSLRAVSRNSRRSMNTVVSAYRELEARGLIESRNRSGFFLAATVPRPEPPGRPSIPQEPRSIRMSALTDTVVADSLNPDMVPMGSTTLHPSLLPTKALARIARSLVNEEWDTACSYAPPGGLEDLRIALSRRHLGLLPQAGPEDFLITSGCSEAVSLSLEVLAAPGSVVLVESPVHFGTLQMLRDRRYRIQEIPIDPRFGMDPQDLERALASHRPAACILTPTVQNPTGAVMSEETKKTIVSILADFQVPAIEDDLYATMVHRESRPAPLSTYAKDSSATILTCSSYSKILAPGFRIGWVTGPRRILERIRALKAGLSLAAPTLQQMVLAKYLEGSALERHLHRLRNRVRTQVLSFAAEIQKTFPSGTRMTLPEGGNFLWVELPDDQDAEAVYLKGREHGITVVPGPAFSATDRYKSFLRISAPAPLSQSYREALALLGRIATASAR